MKKLCKRCGGWGQADPSGQTSEVRLCPECPGDGLRWPSDPRYEGEA